MSRLAIEIGQIPLKNPVICGAGEHTMTGEAIAAALATGAGAVVAKSTNESMAAKQQLDRTDYALFDSQWNKLPWDFAPPPDASLFGRSGLVQREFAPWIEELAKLDSKAKTSDAYVIPSLILADLDQCVAHVQHIEQAGLRVIELNIGAPHGEEAAKGAIVLERSRDRISTIVGRVRQATTLPLWIKLTGQSEDVTGMAQSAKEAGADAVILMGRFMGFLPDLETERPCLGTSAAIGGSWALPLTARWLMMARRRIGPDFPLLATNGARSGLDVARFLLAGASATEMTSAVFSGGYRVLEDAIAELDDYLKRRDRTSRSLLGRAADSVGSYHEQDSRAEYWRQFAPPTLA
jgi:dihydroorotate dehydrogenase (NAD+) catalytic subunit